METVPSPALAAAGSESETWLPSEEATGALVHEIDCCASVLYSLSLSSGLMNGNCPPSGDCCVLMMLSVDETPVSGDSAWSTSACGTVFHRLLAESYVPVDAILK